MRYSRRLAAQHTMRVSHVAYAVIARCALLFFLRSAMSARRAETREALTSARRDSAGSWALFKKKMPI